MRTLADQMEKQRSSSIGNFRHIYNNRSSLFKDHHYHHSSNAGLNKLSSGAQSRINIERQAEKQDKESQGENNYGGAMNNLNNSSLKDNNSSMTRGKKEKTYLNSLGIMDPDQSNIVPSNPNYYKYKSEGLIYFKEDQNN